MKPEEILKRIKSVKLCMMSHPDNEPNSEFSDRINDLTQIQEALIIPVIKDCSTCKHEMVSKYIAPCYGCRDNGGYDNFESVIIPQRPNVHDYDLKPYGYICDLTKYIDKLEQEITKHKNHD